MKSWPVLILCLAPLIGGACASPAGDAEMEPEAETETLSEAFVGTWRLVSYKDEDDDGETIYPMGDDAFGRIVYGGSGNMAVVLMRRGREATEDPGFFAYSGSYDLDEAAGTVTHHIEACINPSWIGGDRVRKFERLDGDRIALRPVEGTSELIWQKEP